MFRLIAFTQDWENYGARWKPKFGTEILVAELSLEEASRGYDFLRSLVEAAREKIDFRNDLFETYVVDWSLFEEGELTPFESDQLRFEGKITSSPKPVDFLRETA